MLVDRQDVVEIIEYMIRNNSYIDETSNFYIKKSVSVEDIKNAIRLIEALPTTDIE